MAIHVVGNYILNGMACFIVARGEFVQGSPYYLWTIATAGFELLGQSKRYIPVAAFESWTIHRLF